MKISDLSVGQQLPIRHFKATNVSLFCYNAAIWNPHRIHYDEKYTKEIERHPEIVIDGPLQGDWLNQTVTNWIADDGSLLEFSYSNRRASYLGETLHAGGEITSIDLDTNIVVLDLYIKNEKDEITTPGNAKVKILN
tara:strand:+ start:1037 stop:1447 length:411 start_codon:yes stop_codon:yes gene_type:complete